MVGKSLSHYKIEAELGRGGMGIVYRAQDTKLDRTVAIKVLPSAALASEDDRARFYREAKAVAQLHHPHIASVFEIDEAVPEGSKDDDLRPFIAMEYIEGETLHDRIQQSPLKIKEAVRIAREIASALEAAHEKGIVHRDIKSANVMLTSKGSAKVLDFGLAQTAASTKLTRMGSTLGTVAYMSPEQARGEEVDLRTDLWSLGAVLYEMVAGRSPFPGDYEQAVVYEILNQEPEPLTAVRTGVPMDLEAVVNKCLAKDAEYRYPSAEALLVDLKRIEASSGVRTTSVSVQTGAIAATVQEQAPSVKRPWLSFAAVGVSMLLAGLFLGNVFSGDEPAAKPVVRTHLILPGAVSPLQAAITPDDRALYYVMIDSANGRRRLARYDFESGVQGILPQTENARDPVASPDGRWIAFQRTGTNQWWRLPVSGGDPIEIPGAISRLRGRHWAAFTPNGDFIFPDTSWSIVAVDRAGSARMLASAGADGMGSVLAGPAASPSGKFVTWSNYPTSPTPAWSWMLRAGRSEPEKLVEGAFIRSITTSGHALFQRGNVFSQQQIIVVPLDLDSGVLLGEEVAIGVWSVAVSPSGLLVYEEHAAIGEGEASPSQLYRIDALGSEELLFALPGVAPKKISISNDGSKLAVNSRPDIGAFPDMYIVDLSTGTNNRLTRGGYADISAWGGGDEYLYFGFQDNGTGAWNLVRRRADGSGVNQRALPDSLIGADPDVTPDGRLLVFSVGLDDIWGMDVATDSVFAIVTAKGQQTKPAASPDGRYVVYVHGGNPCGSIQVSTVHGLSEPREIAASGCFPVWTHDGKYIYYQDASSISRVRVTTEPVFNKLGLAEDVYSVEINRPISTDGGLFFDVAADGTLYVAHGEAGENEPTKLWVVHNWFEELNRIAPRSE